MGDRCSDMEPRIARNGSSCVLAVDVLVRPSNPRRGKYARAVHLPNNELKFFPTKQDRPDVADAYDRIDDEC